MTLGLPRARPRRAGRRTNLTLLALVGIAAGTGAAGYGAGTASASRLIAVAHGAAGLAMVLLVPWKSVIVRRGLARQPARPGRVGALVLAALLIVCVLAGLAHTVAGWRLYLGLNALQVHVGAAVVAVPLLVSHIRARPQRVRRTDLSRRSALAGLALGGGAVATYALTEGALRLLRLPGARRRGTGSFEVGSGRPELMPVTQWFTDRVPEVDRDTWRLRLAYAGTHHSLGYSGLAAAGDSVRATLDCTGGWYAEQDWQGIRLDHLLAQLPLPAGNAAGRSVEVVSATGYRRRFPLADAPVLLLAISVGGAPLSAGHGAPARLVAPGRRGYWWVKWVERVEVLDEPWQRQAPFPLQ